MIARARLVRWLPLLAAGGAAAWGARALAPRAAEPAAPTTYLAYRVAAAAPLSFHIAPGDRDLALTVQVEHDAADAARFSVHAVLEDAAGQARWRGGAELESSLGAVIGEDDHAATAPRTLRIDLPDVTTDAQLLVIVDADRPALVRLVRRVDRDSLSGHKATDERDVGSRASLFGWAYLDDAARDVLLTAPLLRRSAADDRAKAELVHVRLTDRAYVPPPAPEPGELLAGLAGVAYTVRGPGKLRVALAGGAGTVQIYTLDNHGAATQRSAAVPGELAFDAPAGGALTVEVAVPTTAQRVRAYVEGGATRLGSAQTGEISPDRRRVVLWRARPFGPPVVATLAGDGNARVRVRAAGPAAGRLRWRVLDAAGRVAAQGTSPAATLPSLFDRLRPIAPGQDPVPAAEPLSLSASGPPGGRLELIALDAPLDLELQAADDVEEVQPAAAYAVELEHTRLRYAPYLRSRWVGFIPDNHAALEVSAGRVVLEGQVRLEPAGAGPNPGGPFRTVEPVAPRTRQLIVEGDADGPVTGFPTGHAVRLLVEGNGADAGRLVLGYLLGPEALGGTLRVLVDGKPAEERVVNVRRGSVRLRGLEPGPHDVVVDSAPGTVFTAARGAGGAAHYAERAVWRLERGATLTVPVTVGAGGTNLNIVLYSDAPVAASPQVVARVDVDQADHGVGLHTASGRTQVARAVVAPLEPIRSVWLDRERGASARARFVIHLGADLGTGLHRVRLSVADGPDRLHARFFVTGREAKPQVSFAGTEWAED